MYICIHNYKTCIFIIMYKLFLPLRILWPRMTFLQKSAASPIAVIAPAILLKKPK